VSVIDTRISRWRGSARLAATLAVAVLLVASCGDDDPPASANGPDDTTTTTEGSSTTSTTDVPPTSTTSGDEARTDEQAVIDSYLAYWDARFEANTGTPDPQDPALAEHATGAQLDVVIAETQKNLDEGLAFREREDSADIHRVRVVSIDGDLAIVQECFVDDGLVVRRDTGEVVNDAIATQSVRGELSWVDGRWRVSKAELLQQWEGVAACALDS
jgi:hypothetical protein